MKMQHVHDAKFQGNVVVGTANCRKICFVPKIALNVKFGQLVQTESVMQIPFSRKQEPEIQSCFDINLKFHHPENVNVFDSLFEELKLQRGRSLDDCATFNNETSDTKVELGNVIKNGIGISGSDNKHGTGSSFDTNTRASRGR